MRRLVLALIALALIAAACGDDDTATTTTPAVSTTTIPGARVAVSAPVSVAEALASALDQPLLVTGYLFVLADGSMVLADAILESYPPQPGGVTIPLVGFDLEGMTGVQTAPAGSAVSQWVDVAVEILGTVAGGALTYYDNPAA
jgi:hypothetical protein